MQENRSFDHYFGTLSGVRGFGDPRAMRLANGRSVFAQPDPDNPDGYLLPYHLDSSTSAAQAVPSLSHAWQIQHASWANGKMDGWLRSHIAADSDTNGPFTMGYYTSADIPFQYALANAFTICDNYFCSVLGPTHPNRYMWMTGTVDPDGPDRRAGPRQQRAQRHLQLDHHGRAARRTPASRGSATSRRTTTAPTCSSSSASSSTPRTSSSLYQNAFGVSTLFERRSRPATPPWPSRRTAPTARCRR